MIELPADLAEVLKTLQSNEQGADIVFPDGNEDLLAELAAAWAKWNEVADSHVTAIVAAANRAMASMSGPAADSFAQYLKKFAAGEGSHVTTTLQAGHVMEDSMRGAAQAVGEAKTEMIRELDYAKKYIEAHPAGKHDDIAKSEGVKQAVTLYHQYIGRVSGNMDTTLRTNAGYIADMTGMGQTCSLNGSTASGGSGVGGVGGLGIAGGAGGVGTMSGGVGNLPGGLFGAGAGSGLPGGVGATTTDPSGFSLPGLDGAGAGAGAGGAGGGAGFAGSGFSLPGLDGAGAGGAAGAAGSGFSLPGLDGAGAGGAGGSAGSDFSLPGLSDPGTAGSYGGSGAFGGGGYSGSGTSGSTGGSGLEPFSLPAPNLPQFGTDTGAGGSAPVFTPLSTTGSNHLGLAGLGDLSGIGGPGVETGSSYVPSQNFGSGLGSSIGSSSGGSLGNLGGSLGGALGALGGSGGGSGGGARAGLAPFGGGSSPYGLGGGAARGLSGTGSTLAGSRGAGAAGGMTGAGSAVGRAGAGAGTLASGGATGRSGASGMGGGHMPGMGGGGRGGGKDGRHGNRFVSPTRFGSDGEEEEQLHGDRGILGQAGEVGPRDRHWHRARRRWLDDARDDATFATAEPETQAAPAAPASESEVLNQLAGVLLGGGATGTDGTGTDGAGADGAGNDGTGGGGTGSGGTGSGGTGGEQASGGTTDAATATADHATARRETPVTTTETAGSTDDASYLERSRSVAARRGHPDAPTAETGSAATASDAGAAATPQRAPLREEGGFQVPSPFLRAALSRLAAPAAD
ncbi:hypothetical protein GCM10009759_36380 [Kitasatospora saccharophila]|uniref:Outer membrane channel protein CpnT-like N-terminal domain-containing protein n=1 Tax=Kitasatospora saccharophila TaxID=407973 RepID=A0ABN2X2J3_9ACTN